MAAMAECDDAAKDDISDKISERSTNSFIPLVEDVAEWLSLTFDKKIDVNNIMDELDNGVLICKLAEKVRMASENYFSKSKNIANNNMQRLPSIKSKCHEKATKESFLARENAANFLR